MNASSNNPTNNRDLIFGLYDQIAAHRHAYAEVVLAPVGDDGKPAWSAVSPDSVEDLPGDEWPENDNDAARACVLISEVDGCAADSAFIVNLDDGVPTIMQVCGNEADAAIAEQIVARDAGVSPPFRAPGPLARGMDRLAANLAGGISRLSDFDRLLPFVEHYGGEIRDRLGKAVLFGATVEGKGCQIECFDDSILAITDRGARRISLPEKQAAHMQVIDPAEWDDDAIPERHWFIDGMIPGRQVTLLSGDGGTGKSLLAYQIGIAGALGLETIGLTPAVGGVVYLAAEDDEDELQRRGHDILRSMGRNFADLRGKMRVIPMAGLNAEMVHINPDRRIEATALSGKISDIVREFRPALLILDTSADVFGGDEINRVQVRFFVSMLRRLAMDNDTAVLLLSHPSVAGMQTGTGLSGSTAWNNSVRSRLYLTADKDDEDGRILKGMKSNYARKGGEIRLRWHDGAFVLNDGRPSAGAALVAAHADKVFLRLLSEINRSGRRVSPSRSASYAPTVMSKHPDRDGMSKTALEDAMHRHLASGVVAVLTEGSPSRQRQRLVVVADEIAQGRSDGLLNVPSNGTFQRSTNGLPTPTNGVCSHTPITPVPLVGTNGPLVDGPAPANDNAPDVAAVSALTA